MSWNRRLRRIVRNPLLAKDGLVRVRSWSAPAAIFVYLAVLGLFAWLVIAVQGGSSSRPGPTPAQIGSVVFTALAVVQLVLVCVFAPGVASGSISGERERQTLDVLLVSGVTSATIVWGKLIASLAFLVLLITAALPLFATVFLLGGIDLQQFAVAQLLTLTTALSVGAASLFMSTVFRRTLVSTVTSYAVAFAGTVGTGVVGGVLTQIHYASQPGRAGPTLEAHPLLFANPLYALVTMLQVPSGASQHVGRILQLLFLDPGPASSAGPAVEPWQATVAAELVVVVLCIAGAVRILGGHRRRRLLPRQQG